MTIPRIVSVNVSLPRDVELDGKRWRTAILKEPVDGSVRVERLGLQGDRVGNPRVHGGPWQSVYAFANEHVAHWRGELAREEIGPGYFGENLTTEGLFEKDLRIGDRLRVGTAVFAVTHPRIPCGTLEARTGIRGFARAWREARRPGFYLRVVEAGVVAAGDTIAVEPSDPDTLTVDRLNELRHFDRDHRVDLARAQSAAELTPGWREWFAERLRRVKARDAAGA